jgi:hypothetical protein
MRLILALSCLLLLTAGGAVAYRYLTAHFVVTLQNKPLVAVASMAQGEEVIDRLKMQYAPNAPQVVDFVEGDLTVQPLRHAMPVSSVADAVARLQPHLIPVLNGWGIFVDGAPLVMVASREEAVQTIALMEQQAQAQQDGIPTFHQRILLAPFKQSVGGRKMIPVMTAQQAAAELTHPPLPQYVTVKRGDSFYAIAVAHKLTVVDIKHLNSEMNPATLQPGDKVRLPDITAPVTIVVR